MYKIYNGDCLEVMDKLIEEGIKVDCILTDPPYGMEFKSNHRKIKYDKFNKIPYFKTDSYFSGSGFLSKKLKRISTTNTVIIGCL